MMRSLAELADAFFRLGAGEDAEPREVVAEAAPAPPAPLAPPAPPSTVPAAMVFDTETTGLKDPLAVQIAWCIYNAGGYELSARAEYLALPPGRKIDPNAQKVHHISAKTLAEKGMAAQFVLTEFFEAFDRVAAAGGKLVVHNAQFDARVVTNTARSCGLARDLRAADCFCTMEHSKRRLNLTNRRGGLKPPKNIELHEHLLGPVRDELELHDALNDVRVTAASFFAGGERGWW